MIDKVIAHYNCQISLSVCQSVCLYVKNIEREEEKKGKKTKSQEEKKWTEIQKVKKTKIENEKKRKGRKRLQDKNTKI